MGISAARDNPGMHELAMLLFGRQLADLGVQHLHNHRRCCLEPHIARPAYPGDTLHHLCLPGRDLVRVHFILLCAGD